MAYSDNNRKVKRRKVFDSNEVTNEVFDAATLTRSLHSDYARHNSPQETFKRVLTEPIFNGNCSKNIVQSNKSELYYQLTFPLENCGRMYVLPAPTLPCYSTALPLHFVCKLFDLNPHNMPLTHVVPIQKTPWHFLAAQYNVLYAIVLPSNVSLLNRRDPVIQEGGIESIELIFVYDNCDADVQLNNPLSCFNKHEDYDGDTNTQSIGKGVESRVEIRYNMSRQMLPLLRSRNIISQNLLSRLMLALVLDCTEDYESHERLFNFDQCKSDNRDGKSGQQSGFVPDKRYAWQIGRMYDDVWNRAAHKTNHRSANSQEEARTRLIFTMELVRRVDTVLARLDALADQSARQRARQLFFGNEEHALIYIFYLCNNLEPLRRRSHDLRRYMVNHYRDIFNDKRQKTNTVITETLTKLAQDYLHEASQIWRESVYSYTSNCQSLMDNVARTVYTIWGEDESTHMLNSFNRYIHGNHTYLFMGRDAFSLECVVNVLSRAKGTFDSLLSMQCDLYRRFRDDALLASSEATRRRPLALSDRDIIARVSREKTEHNLHYVDNFVEGSKKIPKYCKQANSKKWALQNVYYHGGHLWMDAEVVVSDVSRFFSLEMFGDIDMISAILSSEIE